MDRRFTVGCDVMQRDSAWKRCAIQGHRPRGCFVLWVSHDNNRSHDLLCICVCVCHGHEAVYDRVSSDRKRAGCYSFFIMLDQKYPGHVSRELALTLWVA